MQTRIIPLQSMRSGRAGTALLAARESFALARAFDSGPGDRRIVVWGTGACARELLPLLSEAVEIVAFADNCQQRWGWSIEGTPVVAPAALRTLNYNRLIVASDAASAISSDLASLGLLDERVVQYTGRHDAWRIASLVAKPVFAKLQIGITTRCNLICQHCPRDADPGVYSDLSLAQFERYLSRFDPAQFGNLLISDFGEVTIVKSFLSYLRAAQARGWQRVEFVTNATNGQTELWETIFRERLAHDLVISLEGTGEVFEAVRGFPWDRFARNVRTIAEANARNGSPATIMLNAVCMRSNLTALPDVVDFAAEQGVALSFVHLNPSNQFNNPLGRSDNHLDYAERAQVVATFAEVVRRAAAREVRVILPEDFPEFEHPAAPFAGTLAKPTESTALRCYQPLRWVEVDLQGKVYPCCQMAKRHPVGNLEEETFEEIWDGDGYRELLDGLRPSGVPVDVCRTCNIYNGKNF